MNPEAAESGLKAELLRIGPFCYDSSNQVVFCSPNASRTQRAGIHDLRFMHRSDRRFW